MKRMIEKADVLIEALPYIQRFRGEIIVVKVGGSTQEDPAHLERILTDVTFMESVGMRPVVVHGGGKAITRRLKEAGNHGRDRAGDERRDQPGAGGDPGEDRRPGARHPRRVHFQGDEES
jgi:acetylglutamate kinase